MMIKIKSLRTFRSRPKAIKIIVPLVLHMTSSSLILNAHQMVIMRSFTMIIIHTNMPTKDDMITSDTTTSLCMYANLYTKNVQCQNVPVPRGSMLKLRLQDMISISRARRSLIITTMRKTIIHIQTLNTVLRAFINIITMIITFLRAIIIQNLVTTVHSAILPLTYMHPELKS